MATLLVVDDEPNLLYSLERSLEGEALRVLTASTARQGIELVREKRPDVVIIDVRLPDMSGLEAFRQMHAIDPRLPVIVITAFASTDTAIEAIKQGAFEYLLKPVDFTQLRQVVGKAVEVSHWRHVPAVFDEPDGEGDEADHIVGRSPAMQEIFKAVGRVAQQNMTVLIQGESGTGKELVARAIYSHSDRSNGPFLAINCAAIPETLLESELFGHERGAFTGADRRRIGKFEQTSGGTLFLDEIGDMSPATQAKVLRLLQEQRFERLGGNETIETDVRVIAATNCDLESLVRAGQFRKDLFYRLKVYAIYLPPLRERKEDIPLLAEYLLKQASRELGKPVRSLAPEALALLERYDWPGNVRELQSTLKYAVLQATGEMLTPGCFPDDLQTPRPAPATPAPAAAEDDLLVGKLVSDLLRAGETDIYRKVCHAVDHLIMSRVLAHANGNQVVASELLGISRTTLRGRLRALGLNVEKHLSAPPDPGGCPTP